MEKNRWSLNFCAECTYTFYKIECSYQKILFLFLVPEYHVTPIYYPKLHKRSTGSLTHLRLNAFGRDIDLLLNPTDGILAAFDTPVYVARRNMGGENIFEKINNVGFKIWL